MAPKFAPCGKTNPFRRPSPAFWRVGMSQARRIEVAQAVLRVRQRPHVVVADSKIQRQPSSDLPIVLEIGAYIVAAEVAVSDAGTRRMFHRSENCFGGNR